MAGLAGRESNPIPGKPAGGVEADRDGG
jgi:hypothetical protein